MQNRFAGNAHTVGQFSCLRFCDSQSPYLCHSWGLLSPFTFLVKAQQVSEASHLIRQSVTAARTVALASDVCQPVITAAPQVSSPSRTAGVKSSRAPTGLSGSQTPWYVSLDDTSHYFMFNLSGCGNPLHCPRRKVSISSHHASLSGSFSRSRIKIGASRLNLN